jgi:hypothetical protein
MDLPVVDYTEDSGGDIQEKLFGLYDKIAVLLEENRGTPGRLVNQTVRCVH